ncbi:MAG: thiamine-monophosphate kinase [Bacteroidetes bacterium]|nr:MAG: thiamine-monophosphate kinase [Bacteroidota bacterium]
MPPFQSPGKRFHHAADDYLCTMLENKTRTELSSLGEFGLIRHLTSSIELKHTSSLKGVGDDAAVIDKGDGNVLLVSTDMLLEGVHFDLAYVPLKHLGYKAAAVNISDICAMNGTAKQMLVSFGASSRFSLEAIEELYEGIYLACRKYNVDVVGGDTSSSKTGLTISITVIGEAKKENVVYRSGAQEKDLLCVSGDLGSAYLGLLLLEREKQVFVAHPGAQPDLEGNDYILERQLKPDPRTDIIQLFAELGIKPTSMIDISDGLASEIMHLCTQSEKGCTIYDEKLPIDPSSSDKAHEFNLDPTTCMLNGGEDYELLFTIAMSDYEKIKNSLDISVIGHITDKASGVNLVTRDGTQHPITAQGWNAFK